MPTQRLIDINTAAITYRRECLQALKIKHWPSCIGAIISLNSELPADDDDKKYRIIMDSMAYEEQVKQNYIIVCKKCKVEHPYYSITFFNVNLSKEKSTILGISKERIWLCPKCSEENQLLTSKIIESSLQKPYYLRTVPEPPKAQHGLLSKMQFDIDMENWVWLVLPVIEDGFARYRDDNWNKQDDGDDLGFDTSIEESS
jgi:hypothetical protein